jgi:hypothetical protein
VFIELVEFLRCPEDHPEVHCVLATTAVNGRDIVRGIVGCPACKREYQINQSVVQFGTPVPVPGPASELPDAGDVHALLGLDSPGGYAVLVGNATRLAAPLSKVMTGVGVIGVNAPGGLQPGEQLSLLETESVIPLRTSMARGVVLGSDYLANAWIGESRRVLLPGLRLVVMGNGMDNPEMEQMAVGRGMWVGRKRTR